MNPTHEPSEPPFEPPSEVAGLPRELPPPPGLEDRLAARLAARGVLARRGGRRWLLPLAAALAGVVAGWWARPLAAPPAGRPAPGSLYLLLLSRDPVAGPPVAERVAIYSAWAHELAGRGELAAAEKLAAESVIVDGEAAPRPGGGDDAAPSGFFLVRAADLDAAVRLARASPHARLGGRVTVRPVEPTP